MKIEIVTVVVGIPKNKGWILTNFLEGIKFLSKKIDINLNIVTSNVPLGTDWGKVPSCDYNEIKKVLKLSKIPFKIWDESDFKPNPQYNQIEDTKYPSTGESHSKLLDKIFYHFSKNLKNDFFLLMDYDSFFNPSKINEFIEILNFSLNKNIVFGGVYEEIKVKEIYNDSPPVDYIMQSNKSPLIKKGNRSIVYLPRIHPMFMCFTKQSLTNLINNNNLHIYPLKTIGIFDKMHYILYGDCGVFLMNSISKKTGITWILKSHDEMPVFHYNGMTLKISKSEQKTKKELEKIFKNFYG